MRLSGIVAIMNSNGDSASPWKMPLWVFASSSYCEFRSPGFHGFLDKVYDLMWYFVHFEVVYYPDYWLIDQVGRVFGNDSGDLGSIPGNVIPKTFKMVLDTSLLNTQQYKVRIKGKVEQSREMSSALPYTSM